MKRPSLFYKVFKGERDALLATASEAERVVIGRTPLLQAPPGSHRILQIIPTYHADRPAPAGWDTLENVR